MNESMRRLNDKFIIEWAIYVCLTLFQSDRFEILMTLNDLTHRELKDSPAHLIQTTNMTIND